MRATLVAWRRPRAVRYGLATLALGLVAAVQVRLFASAAPWFLYTPAVVVVALLLGGGPGVWTTLLAAVAAAAVVRRPDEAWFLSATHWAASSFFVATTLGLVGLVLALRTALLDTDALREERDRSLADSARREAFLASVLASSTDCIKVLSLDGRLTYMSEGGQRVMEVSDFNAVAGCPWPDFWRGAGNAEAEAAVAAARAGEARSFIGRAATFGGTPKWWHVAVSPIAGPDGRPERILSVSRDITELRESEEARDRFVRLAENSRDFIGMAHRDGRVFYLNDAAKRLVGLEGADIATLAIADFFPPDQAARIAADVLPAVERDGHWAGEVEFRHFGTGELIPMLYSVFPITDADGTVTGYGTVTRDFRERKAVEERLHLLNGEMAHRLKNTLGVVQAIASQTLGHLDRASVDAFTQRLVALAGAHDVLLQQSWAAADLRTVAERVLATFNKGGGISCGGPDVPLGPRATLALSLLLHELGTNAVKHGALSVPDGHIAFRWDVADGRLTARWEERGGPPAVAPTRKGFGSRIIRMGLSGSGGVDLRYGPDGLTAEMTAPLDQLQLA